MVEWERIIDVAEIVTAVSAVVAVVLATWLGLKAIRIAKADNGQAQQEFLYGQVDSVLQSALALTSAASDLATDHDVHAGPARRALHHCAEKLESRIRVLTALKLVPAESENAQHVQEFASALVIVALARHELVNHGRNVLIPTIFDGDDEVTAGLLRELAQRVHGHESYEDSGHLVQASGGQGISTAFDGAAAVAARLRNDLVRGDWDLTINQSLRLVMPWVRVKLGSLRVQFDNDGAPVWLSETRDDDGDFDEDKREIVPTRWPQQVVEDWIDQWPAQFWRSDDNGDIESPVSPEKLVELLLRDIRSEFLDRLLALIADLRAGLPDPGKST